jgi:signal transduction histidine kinase
MFKNISLPHKKITWALHAIAWIIVIIIPLYLNTVFGDDNKMRLYQFYVHTCSAVLIFYLGYLWLVPKYFLQDKRAMYVLLVVGLILLTYAFTVFINDYLLFDPVRDAEFKEAFRKATGKSETPPFRLFGFFNHILASALISGFAMGLGVMEKLKQNEQRQKELEKEKLNSELAFLKNQVSPHFFFNTLNNIYSLIGIDGPTAQDSVLKLSKMMRYLLYESEQGETKMSHEIEFMNNYIDLMKLRLSAKVDLQVSFPREFTDFTFPPLLFIPFIENAFKHGISYRERSFIQIRMEIRNGQIIFITENSIGTSTPTEELQHSGIGLNNVRKRLALLFADRHQLTIAQNDSIFKVELTIYKEK